MKPVQIPDDSDYEKKGGNKWWRSKYNDHFASNEHVSLSAFAEYHGTRDLGLKLHIPAAGTERSDMNAKTEAAAQRIRSRSIRNVEPAAASNGE